MMFNPAQYHEYDPQKQKVYSAVTAKDNVIHAGKALARANAEVEAAKAAKADADRNAVQVKALNFFPDHPSVTNATAEQQNAQRWIDAAIKNLKQVSRDQENADAVLESMKLAK